MTTTIEKAKTRKADGGAGKKTNRRSKAETAVKREKPERYTVSDGALLLNLEVEGKWFIVTSPLDPELVTQARSIQEAFYMAYDAKKLLDEYRAELAEDVKARRASVRSGS